MPESSYARTNAHSDFWVNGWMIIGLSARDGSVVGPMSCSIRVTHTAESDQDPAGRIPREPSQRKESRLNSGSS